MEKGGRTKRIHEELQGLRERGHDVRLVVFAEPPEWIRRRYPDSDTWTVLAKREGGRDLALIPKLRSLIRAFRPHIIDAHCEGSALYAGLASRLTASKCVATVHRSEPAFYRRSWKTRLCYQFTDGLVAVSEANRHLMTTGIGLPREKIAVIRWGIDAEPQSSAPGQREAREQLDLPDGAIALSLGHLGPIKGHEDSIRAIAQVREQVPGIRLYIAGDGAPGDYTRIEGLIGELGLEERVTLVGQVANPLDWLAACDVFLLPSIEEAFGLVFLEAGLCGRPAIGTRIGGIPEIIRDGVTGYLVDPGDPEAISKRLLSILESPDAADRMGVAARKHVTGNFLLNDRIDELCAYLERIAQPHHDPDGKAAA